MDPQHRIELEALIADLTTTGVGDVVVELAEDRFGSLGAALDHATRLLAAGGYHLVKVRTDAGSWIATYRSRAE